MVFHSQTLPGFWLLYNQLPEQIKQRASRQAVILVENGKIQSVTANGPIPTGAEVIDLSR